MVAIPLQTLRLEAPIGEGAWSQVWRATDTLTERPLAVKVLTARSLDDPLLGANFSAEVRAVAALDHPVIVRLHDFGELTPEAAEASDGLLLAGQPYLVLDFAPGRPLYELPGPLPYGRLRHILLELLDALAHAHARGVVHRDLKPDNVLVDGDRCRLTDFGIARPSTANTSGRFRVTRRTDPTMLGTPHFMAPEQIEGRWRDQGPWTDLYSFGCMVYEMVCGRPPFDAESVMGTLLAHMSAPVPDLEPVMPLPVHFDAWVQRLLAKRPADRFQRAADAAWELLALGLPDGDAAPVPGGVTLGFASTFEQFSALRPHSTTEDMRQVDPTPRFVGPPMPEDWRRDPPAPTVPPLHGGRHLFGLRPFPLIGRERARDALWSALRAVHDGRRARLLALTGPSGCGKSRLTQWLAERAHELGVATTLTATHEAGGSPQDGLGPMLVRYFACEGLGPETIEARVEAHLPDATDQERHALQALLAGEAHEPASQSAEQSRGGTSERARVVRFASAAERYVAIRRVVGRLAERRPVVLVLDDAVFGDDSLRFVDALLNAQRHDPAPILVLVTAADEAVVERRNEAVRLGRLLERVEAERLIVEPLTGDERVQVLRDAMGLAPSLAERLQSRTEGNPMFAAQLVADWIQRGLIEGGVDGLRLRSRARAPLPDGLHELWMRRIERLLAERDPTEGFALEIAACLGRGVDMAEWSEACRQAGTSPCLELLERMLNERLALGRGGDDGPLVGWSFVHATLQESVERRADEAGRKADAHRAIVRMLQRRGGIDPARLARHLADAGDVEAALGPALWAAELALSAGELNRAEALLDRRDRLLDEGDYPFEHRARIDGWLLRSELALLSGRWADARRLAERVGEVADAHRWPDAGIRGALAVARVAFSTGRLAAAWRHAEDAEQWAGAKGEARLLAEARYLRGRVMQARGALESADRCYREAQQGFELLSDPDRVAWCEEGRGLVALAAGQADEARRRLARARDCFVEGGARLRVAECSTALGAVAGLEGDLMRAEVFYREALDHYDQVGAVEGLEPRVRLGMLHIARGDAGRARPMLAAACAEASGRGVRPLEAVCYVALLVCDAVDADWAAWREHLTAATRVLDETGFVDRDLATVARRAGQTALDAGEPIAARGAFILALTQWRSLGRTDEVEALDALIRQTRG
ncbi:MAG: protein kinase [Myxococcales bacterium]|nr:protein kinase [Myxococcales bacterium]